VSVSLLDWSANVLSVESSIVEFSVSADGNLRRTRAFTTNGVKMRSGGVGLIGTLDRQAYFSKTAIIMAKAPHSSPDRSSHGRPLPDRRPIATNRRAKYEYELLETIECGVALHGSEVKTLRGGKCSLEEAFARLQNNELWLINCEIPEYPQASLLNHDPRRERKLLLHKRERDKLIAKATQTGMTIVPLAIYFSGSFVKVEIAIAKGRKLHDKREQIKKTEAQKEIRKEMSARRR